MFVASWVADVRYENIDKYNIYKQKWIEIVDNIAKIGNVPTRLITGTISPNEYRFEIELEVENQAELERVCTKFPDIFSPEGREKNNA